MDDPNPDEISATLDYLFRALDAWRDAAPAEGRGPPHPVAVVWALVLVASGIIGALPDELRDRTAERCCEHFRDRAAAGRQREGH